MDGFINSSPELITKLKFLNKKYKNITIAPTYLATDTITIILPPFTNITASLPIRELFILINCEKFTFTGSSIIYNIQSSFTIKKILQTEKAIECTVPNTNSQKIHINSNMTRFIDKMSNFEYVDVFLENNLLCWGWQGVEGAKLSWPLKGNNFRVRMRVRDLWFINCECEKMLMEWKDNMMIFYLYENNVLMIVRVNIIS